MKIIKIFNNNAVATVTEDKMDCIVTGSGIGFKKKVGDEIDSKKIEKYYYYQGGTKNAMYQTFLRTPEEYFDISQKIMDCASQKLGVTFKEQMIVSLADHIFFAVERYKNKVELPNMVLEEVKILYKDEYQIGLCGLDLIESLLGIRLPDDEAGYIVLHILNGSTNDSSASTLEKLEMINTCVDIISKELGKPFDVNGLDYVRLLTHLKFLAQRIFSAECDEGVVEDEFIFKFFKKKNKKIMSCITQIKEYIKDSFNYDLSQKEELYLLIHLYRILY